MGKRSEEEILQRRRKRKAREIQKQNPGMKYIVAWRQVVAAEQSE